MPKSLAEEAAAALAAQTASEQSGQAEQGELITPENALLVIAQSLVGIEKHLMALVYLENTREPEKSGVTYIPSVFQAIYDGSDPFQDVAQILEQAKTSPESQT